MDTILQYESYASKIGNREHLYEAIQKEYNIQSALYPGSHIDITPSLFIPKVTYVDNFKGAAKFFREMDIIKAYIDNHKRYKEETIIEFVAEDYRDIRLENRYDLIISQYAGFVGQATKPYLKDGGYLLCNDSHGDATLAYFDKDYEFIGIVNKRNRIHSSNNDRYFKLRNDGEIDVKEVIAKMKGPKYMVLNENYVFRLKS